MKITTPISKDDVWLFGFEFVDDADLVSGADDVHTTDTTMIAWFQALMTFWSGGIGATGGLIAPEKTRWFLITFFWDGLDWAYHTKEFLLGDISFPDKKDELYTMTRDEPTSAHKLLGMKFALDGSQVAEGVVIADESHFFASQMETVQWDKTACLNCFNISFMPSLSLKIITTQFTEQQ